MTTLRPGDRAAFKTYSGHLIVGIVVAVSDNGTYLVIGDNGETSSMYDDGLFRFVEHNIVRS